MDARTVLVIDDEPDNRTFVQTILSKEGLTVLTARDGLDGLIVPERDGAAIAKAIRAICEDRASRALMSAGALKTASIHRLEVVGDQLYAALANLVRQDG